MILTTLKGSVILLKVQKRKEVKIWKAQPRQPNPPSPPLTCLQSSQIWTYRLKCTIKVLLLNVGAVTILIHILFLGMETTKQGETICLLLGTHIYSGEQSLRAYLTHRPCFGWESTLPWKSIKLVVVSKATTYYPHPLLPPQTCDWESITNPRGNTDSRSKKRKRKGSLKEGLRTRVSSLGWSHMFWYRRSESVCLDPQYHPLVPSQE